MRLSRRYDETYLASVMPEEAVIISNYLRGKRSKLKLELSGKGTQASGAKYVVPLCRF